MFPLGNKLCTTIQYNKYNNRNNLAIIVLGEVVVVIMQWGSRMIITISILITGMIKL